MPCTRASTSDTGSRTFSTQTTSFRERPAYASPPGLRGAPGARGSILGHTWTRKRVWWQRNNQ